MISVVQDYGRERVPREQWTPEAWSEYKEILRRLTALDAKLGQPDCEDPAKAAWMREVEARLAALEVSDESDGLQGLRDGMRELGYIVGRNPDGIDDTVAATLLIVRELKELREAAR